ncbi:MAG: hypothetical protein J6R59_09860 [Paludibacteraceae bacterium]|nr:hypothetical protein [Paludibacteraceae bacterium]
MKVIKNNYNMKEDKVVNVKPYPREVTCEHCGSILEYDKSDVIIGELGIAYILCPLCNKDTCTYQEDEDVTLTIDNIEFPVHFHHVSEATGAVDCCNNEKVREYIRKAIEYFRENKEEFDYGGHISGNFYIQVHRYSGDETYEVTVSNDFYSTDIPFESEDY